MINTKRTREALMRSVEADPNLAKIVDNLVSTSNANEIEYQNKFEAVMSILRDRGMKVEDVDPSDTDSVIAVLMGAVFSMQMELTLVKSKDVIVPIDLNPFDEDDILVSMARERIENTFQEKLDSLKSHEPKQLFANPRYWDGLANDMTRWVHANKLINHALEYEYEPPQIWADYSDSYGKHQDKE